MNKSILWSCDEERAQLTPVSRLISIRALLVLAGCALFVFLTPVARAGVTIQMQINRNCQEGSAYYLVFPSLVTNSPVPPDTAYFAWSASSSQDSGNYADLLPDGTNPGGDGYYGDDFQAFLADMTNLWTLMVTNDTSTNFYSFRFSSFASNVMPFVSVTFPTNGATNVPNQPTFTWNGTTNFSALFVQTTDSGDSFVENASLDPTATNWPSPQPLYYGGSFDFLFSYGEDSSASIAATTPTNGLGQSLPDWSSTSSLSDYADSFFTTASPFGNGPIPLGAALNNTNLTWVTGGNADWFGEAPVSEDGLAAAQSGELQANQTSVLQTTVTGPGFLTFWWQTTGVVYDDFDLEFSVDGEDTNDLHSQTYWQPESYFIPAGTHTLAWTAISDANYDPNDFGFVDIVTYSNIAPPSPGQWTLTGSMTNAEEEQTATLLPNGKVLVTGGTDNAGDAFASAELYNPATGTWAGTGSLHTARYLHTATLLTNGLVLVAGGSTNPYDTSSAFAGAELYNPTNGTWTVTGSMYVARYSHTATLLPDGTVLVAGGRGTNLYPNPNITASAEIYNPVTGTWTLTNSMATERFSHTATLLTNGTVLVSGGEVTNFTLVTGACEIYDPASGTWSPTGGMPNPLANHTATLLPDGTVLVAGGDFDEGFGESEDLVASPFAQVYDPSSQTWNQVASMFSPHDYQTATLLTNGLVLIAGGQGYGASATNSAELYLPYAQTWVRAAAMNLPRRYHTATLLGNGLVLAAGGLENNFDLLAAAELYSTVITPTIILTGPTKLPGGAFQFAFTNTPGSSNEVIFSTNAALPQTNWTVLGSATEVSSGHFQFTDSQATNGSRRFYRVRSP